MDASPRPPSGIPPTYPTAADTTPPSPRQLSMAECEPPPIVVRCVGDEVTPQEHARRWDRFDAVLLALWRAHREKAQR